MEKRASTEVLHSLGTIASEAQRKKAFEDIRHTRLGLPSRRPESSGCGPTSLVTESDIVRQSAKFERRDDPRA